VDFPGPDPSLPVGPWTNSRAFPCLFAMPFRAYAGVMNEPETASRELTIRPLGADTWDAFADLAERHNGVWGGCWCTWFHTFQAEKTHTAEGNRLLKEKLVCEGRAHAALVFDDDRAVAWCQYGPPAELPNIYHRKEYETGLGEPPDYRITCFFVDKTCRRRGLSEAALQGALDLIAQLGGGRVEAYPQDAEGKKLNASLLYSCTRSLFEQAGFTYERPKGKNHCVMATTVAPAQGWARDRLS
jgi:GNAT superfamily N-acetyltransferase